MDEILAKFSAGEMIALVAVAGGLLCGIVAILAGCWENIRKAEIAAALNRDMLARGMSADEIRTVLDAGSKRGRKEYRKHPLCNE